MSSLFRGSAAQAVVPSEAETLPGPREGVSIRRVDRCDGTLTKVRRGAVVVRDFRRKRNVVVRAGKSYLARARG